MQIISFYDQPRFALGATLLKQTLRCWDWEDRLTIYQEYPTGCRSHVDSPYAFKPRLFDRLRQEGAKRVLWCDTSIRFMASPAWAFELIERKGYLFIKDTGHLHRWWTSDQSLKYFGGERDSLGDEHDFLTALLGLDFRQPVAHAFLDAWLAAEKSGAFCGAWTNTDNCVSRDSSVRGHRHDQACAALIAMQLRLEPLSSQEVGVATWADHAQLCDSASIIVDRTRTSPHVSRLLVKHFMNSQASTKLTDFPQLQSNGAQSLLSSGMLGMQSVKLIIGVLSARHYEDRRQACRETWAAGLPHGVDLVFLIGDPQAKLPYQVEDMLYCPCHDDYESLPQKTRWFCAWALAHTSFEYLFKCDDDTYVAVDRLLEILPEHHYVGHDVGGYASGGAGYFLSRQAAFVVSTQLLQTTGAEDMLVQRALAEVDLPFVVDARLHPWNNRYPRPDNELVSAHHFNPRQLRRIHRELTADAPPREELHRLWAKHPHWQGEILLFDDGAMERPHGDEGEYEFKAEQSLLLRWDAWEEELLLWDRDAQVYRCPKNDFTVREIVSSE